MLWFDVESKYEATFLDAVGKHIVLWFDVESKYEATYYFLVFVKVRLWFDVESKYEATIGETNLEKRCCGLM